MLTPCPTGWREVPDPTSGVVTCDPWPEGGPTPCAADEAMFPGDSACSLLGTACDAADDWAMDLPADVPVLYARVGSGAGDGSRSVPFGTIAAATSAARVGTVIALSKGTWDEGGVLGTGQTLWGACVGETRLAPSARGEFPFGVIVTGGSDAVVRNLTIGPAHRSGVVATGPRSIEVLDVVIEEMVFIGLASRFMADITARRVVIRDVASDSLGAITASEGASFTGDQIVVDGYRRYAFVAWMDATQMEVSRFAVADGISRPDALFARGSGALDGAEVSLRDGVFEGTLEVAVMGAYDSDTTAEHVIVRNVRRSDTGHETAYVVHQGSRMTVHRSLVERTAGPGVMVDSSEGTASLAAEDMVIRGPSDLGILAQHGGEVTVNRAAVTGMSGFGIAATRMGTTVDATHVLLSDLAVCVSDTCSGPGGVGLGSYANGVMTVRDFRVVRAALCGVQVASDAQLDLSAGAITRSVLGACVQIDGYDLGRLSAEVVFVDNETNLESTTLPIPEPLSPVVTM